MAFTMRNKNVIIVGGTKGIGEGLTEVFVKEGANTIFTGRDQEAGQALEDRLCKKYEDYNVEFFKADVLDFERTKELFKHVDQKYKGIDVLLINAGIYPEVSIEDMTEEDWDKVMDVNLKSVFVAVREIIPYMKKRGGRIILTSSITGNRVGNPKMAHYSASKAGINGFMRTAALELAPYNITVNAVEPGNIMTPGMKNVLGAEYIKNQEATIPSGKLGSPEDIAYAMMFLASEEASYITGQSIIVDGGQILPESALEIN